MKIRYMFFIIAMLSIIYFTNNRPTEIADRIMVNAIGVDTDDVGYKVSMQVFSPGAGGSETSIDPSQPNVLLVSGKGVTVNDAVADCFGKLGGNVFTGQNQIILFGRDIDFNDKEAVFGYFLSSTDTFLNVDCALAEKTAEDILKIPIQSNSISSEKFPLMISSAAQNGRCIETKFMHLINAMNSNSKSIVLPIFSEIRSGTSSDSSSQSSGGESGGNSSGGEEALPEEKFEISNGAVFNNGKYAAEITFEQMGLIGMLNGTGKSVRTDIRMDNEEFSKSYKIKSREVEASIEDGNIVFNIKCKLTPKDSQMFDSMEDRDKSNAIAISLIEKKAQSLAENICDTFSPELLHTALHLKRYYPDIYRKYKDDTEELYKHIVFKVSIE